MKSKKTNQDLRSILGLLVKGLQKELRETNKELEEINGPIVITKFKNGKKRKTFYSFGLMEDEDLKVKRSLGVKRILKNLQKEEVSFPRLYALCIITDYFFLILIVERKF